MDNVYNNTPEPSLLQAENLSSLSLSLCEIVLSHNELSSPMVNLFQYVHVHSFLGSQAQATALQICLATAEYRGRITSLHLLSMLMCLM